MTNQNWKCKRCGEMVDMVNFRCGCVVSPSPWEPTNELTIKQRETMATNDQIKKAASVAIDAHDKTATYLDELTKMGIPTHKQEGTEVQQKKAKYCPHCYQEICVGEESKHENGKCNEICTICGCPVHPCLPCEEVALLNGNYTDDTYKDLLKLILKDGRRKHNRTGIDTIGVFGAQAKFDVRMDAFPILTTKKVWFKGIVHELLWFLKGDTNIKYLVDNDVHIWDEWAFSRYQKEKPKLGGLMIVDHLLLTNQEKQCQSSSATDELTLLVKSHIKEKQKNFIQKVKEDAEFSKQWGELGEGTYGGMWRAFPYHLAEYGGDNPNWSGVDYKFKVDQIQKVMNQLKNNPDDRRIIVSAWHPYWVDHCSLPPCHCFMQFNTEELTLEERNAYGVNVLGQSFLDEKEMDEKGVPKRRLNLLMLIRSNDMFLGAPFNISSYSLLIAMVAHCVGMEPGTLTYTIGDCHLYVNHLDQVNEQLSRTPKVLPKLWLNPKVKNIFDFKFEDIKLIAYNPHPTIKGDIAI